MAAQLLLNAVYYHWLRGFCYCISNARPWHTLRNLVMSCFITFMNDILSGPGLYEYEFRVKN